MVTWWTHHRKAVLAQRQTQSNGQVRKRFSRCFLKTVHTCEDLHVTFSSPAATLKASSMTEPTAMRTAADECISFHTVSLSTCRGQHRAQTLTRTDGHRWTDSRIQRLLTPIPPHGRTAYIFWLIGPETTNQRGRYSAAFCKQGLIHGFKLNSRSQQGLDGTLLNGVFGMQSAWRLSMLGTEHISNSYQFVSNN